MSRKSRMQSVREAKDRRAKMMAIGGVVVLAGVLAFEMPKVLHKSSGTSAAPPAETTAAPGTGVTATPATTPSGTAAAAVLPTASTKLPNSDVAPRRLKSELFSFSHFPGKDPFVPQVSPADITGTPSTGSGSGAAPSAGSGASGGAASSRGGSGSTYTPASQRTLAKTGAVTLQVNGTVQTVRVGGSFPSSNPLFRLVSVAHGVARIGIANGSYSSGAQTVTLSSGRSLTLVDTADGVRYTIKLVSA
jgi:hypothetical protein